MYNLGQCVVLTHSLYIYIPGIDHMWAKQVYQYVHGFDTFDINSLWPSDIICILKLEQYWLR